MKKSLKIVALSLLIGQLVNAQDVHFSQYFTSPLTLNPAMTGLVNKDFRAAGNYRTQWSSITNNPYETFSVSMDGSMFKNKFKNGDAMGVGLLFLNDKAGAGQLTNQTLGLSLAYHHAIGAKKNQYLSLGVQSYFVDRNIDFRKLVFGDQFDPVSGTASGATGEVFNTDNEGYTDFNTGVMYTGRVNENATIYAGAGFYHVTRPSFTFMNSENRVSPRYSVYFGGSVDITDYSVFYGSANYQQQGPQSEFILGGAAGFILNPHHDRDDEDQVFYLGAWYRFRDAIIPYAGFELKNMTIGLSFDATVSGLAQAAQNNGAMEISLIYNGLYPRSSPKRKYNFACPKF